MFDRALKYTYDRYWMGQKVFFIQNIYKWHSPFMHNVEKWPNTL